ncbi:hypothetical protein [Thiohalobacter thiocyanaticus]|uniref:hypothetical protein n=1 Tax=Thiohalobacter thiocyanaticus TaxID=585455 RepID=UPI000F64003D|nr:hypothetical protein [Thiohalobacter thiocyanaticus]
MRLFNALVLFVFSLCVWADESETPFDVPAGMVQAILKEDVEHTQDAECTVDFSSFSYEGEWGPGFTLRAHGEGKKFVQISMARAETDKGYVFFIEAGNDEEMYYNFPFSGFINRSKRVTFRLSWRDDGAFVYMVQAGKSFGRGNIIIPQFTATKFSVHASGVKGKSICKLAV